MEFIDRLKALNITREELGVILGVCRNEARKWGITEKPPKFVRRYVELLEQRGSSYLKFIRAEKEYTDLIEENTKLLTKVGYRWIVVGGNNHEGYDLPLFATDNLNAAKEFINNEIKYHDWYDVIEVVDLESLKPIDTKCPKS